MRQKQYCVEFKFSGLWIKSEPLVDEHVALNLEKWFHDAGKVARVLTITTEIKA